jgi:hypothetical protein
MNCGGNEQEGPLWQHLHYSRLGDLFLLHNPVLRLFPGVPQLVFARSPSSLLRKAQGQREHLLERFS